MLKEVFGHEVGAVGVVKDGEWSHVNDAVWDSRIWIVFSPGGQRLNTVSHALKAWCTPLVIVYLDTARNSVKRRTPEV